ncbi:MAG: hypothetical protein QGI68_10245 [Pseudomonadales bacterium]|nr:hypothetical protein [Pseudomonadales bacterium]MDP7357317.1 hypothetical protein [Pseudomonadales bacterium]MDP7595934.1 hypothetical protein [Pseudomonadales bacterium]
MHGLVLLSQLVNACDRHPGVRIIDLLPEPLAEFISLHSLPLYLLLGALHRRGGGVGSEYNDSRQLRR